MCVVIKDDNRPRIPERIFDIFSFVFVRPYVLQGKKYERMKMNKIRSQTGVRSSSLDGHVQHW